MIVVPNAIKAEDPTIQDKIDEGGNFHALTDKVMEPMELKLSSADPENKGYITTSFGSSGIGDNSEFKAAGEEYDVVYHDAFEFKDDTTTHLLTMVIHVEVTKFHPSSIHNGRKTDDGYNDYYNGLEVKNDGKLFISSYYKDDKTAIEDQFDAENSTTNYKVTYSFYEGDPVSGNEFGFSGLIGIEDPDNANYLFDTSRDVYFLNANGQESWNKGDMAADAFYVRSNGVFRILPPRTGTQRLGGFNEAGLYIELNNENSFSFEIQGWRDRVHLPELYQYRRYTVIYKDGVDGTVFEDQVNPNIPYGQNTPTYTPPEREGYTFVGWDKEVADIVTEDATYVAQWKKNIPYVVEYYYQKNGEYLAEPDETDKTRTSFKDEKVNVTDDDKTPKKEGYVLDSAEEKNLWEDIVVDDDSEKYPTTLKVYFKESFTVIYEPGTQGTFETQKTENLNYGDPRPAEPDTTKHKPGYDFIGWDLELEDPVTRNRTYVAQWKPWTYTIKYNPNGGRGTMDPQVYTYDSDPMNSKNNEFTRDGYRFVGFLYTDKDGNKTVYNSINDFRKEFLTKYEPYSTITLVAQWQKLPEPDKTYVIPTTGIE